MAGAPPATRTIERVRDELGWEFIQIYGLTETAPLLTVNRMRAEWTKLDGRQQARNLGRAGAPAIGVRLRVDAPDIDGGGSDMARTGEVLAQTNHSLLGYWRNEEETARAQAGNWFHTEDGGTLTDGYLSISDRKKDVIITGGENVSSIEVEDAISLHPGVVECAVIGIPDDSWGELVTALVVTRDRTLTAQDIIAHCHDHLAGYKCPKRVDFHDVLPHTATGKVQKFKLREQFWVDRERQVN